MTTFLLRIVAGGLAIAVPAELRGLELAHRKFGKLPWKDLFEPAAQIADEGFIVSPPIAEAIAAMKNTIIEGNYTGLKQLLAPEGVWLKEGDTIYRKKYAQTLRDIGASGNASYFYDGQFMKRMVEELKENGAILEEEDFLNYTAMEREPVESEFDGLRIIGVPPPASGAVLALILNILQGYDFKADDFGSLAYHRIVEAFKFAFGQRLLLGDPAFNDTVQEVVDYMLLNTTADYMRSMIQDNTTHDPCYYREPMAVSIPSDYGTSHLSVLGPNGDAVAATSTVNSYFGSLVRSEISGVIFNDEMDDFAIPTRDDPTYLLPTVPNYVEPGKRPQSSTTPTILLDGDQVKMVVGASGGAKITTATAQVILDVLDFGKGLSEAIQYPRLHHQLYPNYIQIEKDFPQQFQEGLRERGHDVVVSSSYAIVQAIIRSGGYIHATSDPRKGGKPDGF
jgi:gamma-glutamyltranspeptidase/glutathione hydrolase/leukotriene-C4 hydrolase